MPITASKIQDIQKVIQHNNDCDGWLLYDYRGNNEFVSEILELPKDFFTRRFFYWIPKKGEPVKIFHAIERHVYEPVFGKNCEYHTWQELLELLQKTLSKVDTIAMEYSPQGMLPTISKVDAGTYDLLKTYVVNIISSWPIAEHFIARWNKEQMDLHREASHVLEFAFSSCWNLIRSSLDANMTLTEKMVQEFILDIFEKNDCITDSHPICAIQENSSNPHHNPSNSAIIVNNQLILIDMWCKKNVPSAPYADLSKVAYTSTKVPRKVDEVYAIVKKAQDTAIQFCKKQFENGIPVRGADVDDVAREIIASSGYANSFLHRTGHNIDKHLHGMATNIDNFELHDTRLLRKNTCCSIEPGIYLKGEFGIRLECNMILHENDVEITGKSEHTILTI